MYDAKEGDKVLWLIQMADDILEQYNIGNLQGNGMRKADVCAVLLSCLKGSSREIMCSACLTTKDLSKNLQKLKERLMSIFMGDLTLFDLKARAWV